MKTPHPTDTRTVALEADLDTAFDFLTDPLNLPRWATGFCHAIERRGDDWYVTTSRGEARLELVADRETGVVDWWIEPAPGVRQVAYSRIVPNADGCELVFTQIHTPEVSDEQFRAQVETLTEELELLARQLRRAA